jgi:hypothetical protein
MPCSVLRTISKLSCIAFGIAILVLTAAVVDGRAVLIQSLESKTAGNQPVFNNIQYRPGRDRDIWMMQQSHQGLEPAPDLWDRIAIVVEHGPIRQAAFVQLPPGDLSWNPESVPQKMKATCFMCHPNGPRAIRPDLDSGTVKVGGWDRFRILVWNLRIKTYGRVVTADQNYDRNFRLQSKLANEPLQVPACVPCHRDGGLVRRGSLTRQNFTVIDFMLKNKLMPPPGFSLSEGERADIMKFIGKS